MAECPICKGPAHPSQAKKYDGCCSDRCWETKDARDERDKWRQVVTFLRAERHWTIEAIFEHARDKAKAIQQGVTDRLLASDITIPDDAYYDEDDLPEVSEEDVQQVLNMVKYSLSNPAEFPDRD